MVFWIAILVGILFAWMAVRRGFYESLILLFNIVVSIYVAIFLAPMVVRVTPAIEGAAAFKVALSLLVLGGGCFAILYGVSFVLLMGQFRIVFPRVLDIVVAGGLGFVTGFLALSFVGLVVTATPLSEHWLGRQAGLNRQAEQPNIACMAWCCNLVYSVTGLDAADHPTQNAISRLLEESRQEMIHDTRASETDANEASTAQPGG